MTNMFQFDNSYRRLSAEFYQLQPPVPVSQPSLLQLNDTLARDLGLDVAWLHSDAALATLAGNHWPDGAAGIATVYAGHQFGSFNPQLGDGRAVLLGEVVDVKGQRFDLQLKGSGPTAYSRGGDGRAPLGPVLREYLVSEAMAALGVPTSRSLAAVASGDTVYRDVAEPGAVLTRVARSHIRIGTFQYFAAKGDWDSVRLLTEHVIQRHYPEAADDDSPALGLLRAVIAAQASLVARWQALGFIHGVMNTDNMLLSGETIDYGPCAFMDSYHPETVFSSIDAGGRYAYQNQPGIAQWNLMCLAQALLPLIDPDQDTAVTLAKAALDDFPEVFLGYHLPLMAAKIGLGDQQLDAAAELMPELLAIMQAGKMDFTLTFRALADELGQPSLGQPTAQNGERAQTQPSSLAGLEDWMTRWQAVSGFDRDQALSTMHAANPVYIPRNHRIEAAIVAAKTGDFVPFHTLLEVVSEPFLARPQFSEYEQPPRPDEIVRQTFCGT